MSVCEDVRGGNDNADTLIFGCVPTHFQSLHLRWKGNHSVFSIERELVDEFDCDTACVLLEKQCLLLL